MIRDYPYISLVPKDRDKNLLFRRECVAMGLKDKAAADELWIMCARDPLFYFNTFVWLYEPRPKRSMVSEIPFITWDFQDRAIDDLLLAVESGDDRCLYKSRDMGASWVILECIDYLWRFRSSLSFLLLSRNETYVDDPGNKKALFQKLDFVEARLPRFLKPNMRRVKLAKENLDNGSTIDGESTTGKAARGDRRTAIVLDEFDAFEITDGFAALGSTQFATDCRIFNSTFESTAGAFYAVYKNDEIKKLSMMWWQHPLYNQGLYLDKSGKKRSPWYDKECKKANDPRLIARELDANPEGAQAQFFSPSEIEELLMKKREPVLRGDLSFDEQTSENPQFIKRESGKFVLWMNINEDGKIEPGRKFSIGVDIATGTGASNSCFVVRDRETAQKVAQFVDPFIRPEALASLCVAAARWFNEALIVPEATGPGRNFMDRVAELHYSSNLYCREELRTYDKKRTLIPGWWPTPEAKWELLGGYRKALLEGSCDEPCEHTLNECKELIFVNNTIEHVRSVESNDPSGARTNHGDRPTASALAWKGVKYSPSSRTDAVPETTPPNSIAGRRALHERLKRQRELQWN